MSAEVVLWLVLAGLSSLAIGFGVWLLWARGSDRREETPIAASGRLPDAASHASDGATATDSRDRQATAARASVTPDSSSSEYTPGQTLFSMSPEERARLLAAASARVAEPPRPQPAPSSPPRGASSPSSRPSPSASASSSPPALPVRAAAFASAPGSSGGLVRGYVRDASGLPIAGVSLTLIDLAGGQIGRGETRSDGSYSMLTPGAGSYFLIARARGHHPQAITVNVADEPVTIAIMLTGLAQLTGYVRIAGGAEPVPSALVTLLDTRGEVVASTTTDQHGQYRFPELVGGSYTLAASASPFQPAARLVTVAETGVTTQDIELSAGAYIRGTAWGGQDRRAVADIRVVLTDSEGNVVAVTRTDSAGEYLFSDVPEGNYTVTASGYPPVTSSLRVYSGQKHEHDVELRHPDD